MKVYITARFRGKENRAEIEELCDAVHKSGMEDFCFVRDVENYQSVFTDPQKLWERSKQEVESCDLILIDVSDTPTGGRVAEVGIAYGLGKPVIVIAKEGSEYKPLFDGVATRVIRYKKYKDVVGPLRAFMLEHSS